MALDHNFMRLGRRYHVRNDLNFEKVSLVHDLKFMIVQNRGYSVRSQFLLEVVGVRFHSSPHLSSTKITRGR